MLYCTASDVRLITRLHKEDNEAMTDAQMMTLALAVIIPLSMLISSNSRITEAKETLRAEIRAETAELKGEIRGIMAGIERLEVKLNIHEMEHHHK
jgi:hypothetical protein